MIKFKCSKCGGSKYTVANKGFTLSRGTDCNTSQAVRNGQHSIRTEVKVGGEVLICDDCGKEHTMTPPDILSASREAAKLIPKQQTAAVRTGTYKSKKR